METLFFIWEVIVNISEALLLYLFLNKRLGCTSGKHLFAVLGIFVLGGITTVLNILKLDNIAVMSISLAFHIAYACLCFGGKLWQRLICGCALVLVAAASNAIVTAVVVLFPSVSIVDIHSATGLRFLLMLCYVLCNIAIFTLLSKLGLKKGEAYFPWYMRLGLIALTLMCIVAVFLLVDQSFTLHATGQSAVICSIVSCIFLALIIGMLVLFEGLGIMVKRNNDAHAELVQLKLEAKHTEDIMSIMRTFSEIRHDYHHHIQVLSAYANNDDIAAIKKYTAEYESQYAIASTLSATGNAAFDAIMTAELSQCKANSIHVDLTALLPNPFPLNDVEIASLFGNLMDNAISACMRLDAPKRLIKLAIRPKAQMLSIHISNSSDGSYIKDKNGEFLSYKRNGREVGLGLARIKSILDAHDGHLSIAAKANAFSIDILIPMPERGGEA